MRPDSSTAGEDMGLEELTSVSGQAAECYKKSVSSGCNPRNNIHQEFQPNGWSTLADMTVIKTLFPFLFAYSLNYFSVAVDLRILGLFKGTWKLCLE